MWQRVNPHRWSSGDKTLIAIYSDRDQADNFVAIHPQYHYQPGKDFPSRILEIEEIPLDTVWGYWNPSFP